MSKLTLPESITEAQLIDLLKQLGCKEVITIDFLRVQLENTILFDRKQADYGPSNISAFGLFGCVVRMTDKIKRLGNLLGTKKRRPRNESIEDSLRDLGNYGTIGILCERGVWPK